MSKKLIFAVLLVISSLLVGLMLVKPKKQFTDGEVINWSIADRQLKVKLASAPTSIETGLGNITELSEADGMLFVFNQPVKPIFWMKDMKFAIDLYWIKSGKIIGVEKNMLPPATADDESLQKYYAPSFVDMVLEIPVSKNIQLYSE